MVSVLDHFLLIGRRALVYGAHTPGGAAVARAYAEAGAALVLVAPPSGRAAAHRLQESLQPVASGCERLEIPAGEASQLEAALDTALKAAAPPEIIALCDDVFLGRSFTDTDSEGLERALRDNFLRPAAAVRSLARAMPGTGGRLLFLTHVLGERGHHNTAAYGAAQAATQSLVRNLSRELGKRAITVNGITLGWMDWMQDRLAPGDLEAERAVRFTMSKRAGSAEDLGAMALWLAGSGAGFVTGQLFRLDGGLTLHY